MNNRKQLIESLLEHTRKLKAELDTANTLLSMLQEEETEGSRIAPIPAPNFLAGCTQVEALVRIAKARPKQRITLAIAKHLLLQAGLIKTEKNAGHILFNVLKRHRNRFRRVSRGEYELVENKPLVLPAAR